MRQVNKCPEEMGELRVGTVVEQPQPEVFFKKSQVSPTISLPVLVFQKRHHVLQTAHPSPLSVCRGFFGCRHFSRTNELLQKSGKQPINWKDL